MGDLLTSSIFQAINSNTSYKLLLGCLWPHGVVVSTLHKFLVYYHGGEKRSIVKLSCSQRMSRILLILSSYFPKEAMSLVTSSVGKGCPKAIKNFLSYLGMTV